MSKRKPYRDAGDIRFFPAYGFRAPAKNRAKNVGFPVLELGQAGAALSFLGSETGAKALLDLIDDENKTGERISL